MRHTAPTLCFLLLLAFAARAAEPAAGGNWAAILEKNAPAAVRVSATLKMELSMAGREAQKQETRQDAAGTVLDDSGLTVVSLTMLDPSSLIQELIDLAPADSKISYKSETSDLKIRLPGGDEVPARLIFKDPDLDLAFLLPEVKAGNPKPSFTAVTAPPAGEIALLDDLLAVMRLDKSLQFAPATRLFQVAAVIRKPRTVYVCASDGRDAGESSPEVLLASPAFTADGKFAGIWTVNKTSYIGAAARGERPEPSPVLLPAALVLDLAKQARAAKAAPPAAQDDATTQTK